MHNKLIMNNSSKSVHTYSAPQSYWKGFPVEIPISSFLSKQLNLFNQGCKNTDLNVMIIIYYNADMIQLVKEL